MVGDFGWEHEGTKSGVGTVKYTLPTQTRLKKTLVFKGCLILIRINIVFMTLNSINLTFRTFMFPTKITYHEFYDFI